MARHRAPIWTHWSCAGDDCVSECVDDGGAGVVLARRRVKRSRGGTWYWQIELRGGEVFDYSAESYIASEAAQAGADWVMRQPATRKLFRQEVDRIRQEEAADINRELAQRKARSPVTQSSARQQGFAFAPPPPAPPRRRPVQGKLFDPGPKASRARRTAPARPVPAAAAELPRSRLDQLLGRRAGSTAEQESLPLRGSQTGWRFQKAPVFAPGPGEPAPPGYEAAGPVVLSGEQIMTLEALRSARARISSRLRSPQPGEVDPDVVALLWNAGLVRYAKDQLGRDLAELTPKGRKALPPIRPMKAAEPSLARLKVGDVVHVDGKTKRFVVVRVNEYGNVSLQALSGAAKGSVMENESPGRLTLAADQQIRFSGSLADKLETRAAQRMKGFYEGQGIILQQLPNYAGDAAELASQKYRGTAAPSFETHSPVVTPPPALESFRPEAPPDLRRPFEVGTVVQFVGKPRRYVVTFLDSVGRGVGLNALSGAERGSAPSGVDPNELRPSDDQTIEFVGKRGYTLQLKAGEALSAHNRPRRFLQDFVTYRGVGSSKEPESPKPRKASRIVWQPLLDAVGAAAYQIEKHYHSFPRTLVSEGTYSSDYRPSYAPNREQAAAEMQPHIDALRALRGPYTSTKAPATQRDQARAWKALRDHAVRFLKEYQREASPSIATHYAMHGGVLDSADLAGLTKWAELERKGEL